MIRNTSFSVSSEEAGKRLDALLASRFPNSSRSFCREAILSGAISVGGVSCRDKGRKLKSGDVVEVLELAEAQDNRVLGNRSVPVHIVFRDDTLVAVDKPAGIPVQPLRRGETGTLANGLVARFPELVSVGDQPLMAGCLHRIDAETSGLVLAARTAQAFDEMRRQFASREVVKVYYALVEGQIAVPGSAEHDLAHDPSVPFCRMIDARTLSRPDRTFHARTSWKPVEWLGAWTLLEVVILTGVTHQIRAQLALNGTPIVGDAIYGRARLDTDRHFLHAFSAEFRHPASGNPCKIEAPLTPDFEEFLALARK